MTNPIYPFPEAIERDDIEGAFEIEQGSSSSTDLSKRKMVVPTGGACIECGEDHARALRLREMGHTAWTPSDWEQRVKRTKDKLPRSLVAMCESARINARRLHAGLEKIPATMCAKDEDYYFTLRQILRNDDLLALSGLLVSSMDSGDYEPMYAALYRLLEEMAAKADEKEAIRALAIGELASNLSYYYASEMRWQKPNFRRTLALARAIIENADATAKGINQKLDEKAIKDATKVKEYEGKGKGKRPAGTRFGKMDIVRLPLTRRSKAGLERRWTARDEGPIPTRFDRWSIDRRVFRTKKRSKGAALLIDVSGSMSWREDDLRRVLDEVPAATIALYSGSGTRGQLVIVASKGKCATMTTAARFMLGGNIVDGPALEWLSEQPESVKLWMSDGGITGIHDGSPGEGAEEYCSKLLRKGQIQQVRNANEVYEILSGKRPFVPSRSMRYL